MRIYFNTSALNRPFDDLSSERVRLEAEAVASLVAAVEVGRAEMASSDFLEFEVAQNPDRERALRVRALAGGARVRVRTSSRVATRARELERFGLRGLDALHIAAAEAAAAEVLVTTDDRMIRGAGRATGRLAVKVMGPHDALALLGRGGRP